MTHGVGPNKIATLRPTSAHLTTAPALVAILLGRRYDRPGAVPLEPIVAKKNKAEDLQQNPLPGAEQDPKIPRIHAAALAYEEAKSEHGRTGREVQRQEDRLMSAMEEFGKQVYEHGNVRVDLVEGKTKPKVKIGGEE